MLICDNVNNNIRWNAGERLDNIFEQRCDALLSAGKIDHLAVDSPDLQLTYLQLDQLANQFARYLMKHGFTSGDRIGLMFDKSPNTYIAMLAVLKINAAYVPLDPSFPSERISYISNDSDMKGMITYSKYESSVQKLTCTCVFMDLIEEDYKAELTDRLKGNEKSAPIDELSYVIYTSGTTGKPKGVVIDHPSICNFVRVASEYYGYVDTDRVYQGMTIAFDFSVEELWVPFAVGATLVPSKVGMNLVGDDLSTYLKDNHITAWCCVPTLLSTLSEELPDLRWLLVSGEACPQDLIARWSKPGRKILNAYGPTEATVTATLAFPTANKPITIGKPLPTYTVVILDENYNEVAEGEAGEICIAGIGLARGYINRDDLTAKAFIPDTIGVPNNPSNRLYRSGDLGRINSDREIEYLGRIDTQVKIRGYRIELAEIESVLMQVPGILQVVVNTYTSNNDIVELVAYCKLEDNINNLPLEKISQVARQHLPRYMMPTYIEHIEEIPMSSSHKADRKKLPPPIQPRFILSNNPFVAATSDTEIILVEQLKHVMKLDQASVTDHFFDDLGAHSLLMAQYCVVIRENLPTADISIRDIYQQPNIKQLAELIDVRVSNPSTKVTSENYMRPTKLAYYGCGVLQLSSYIVYLLLGFGIFITAASWLLNGITWIDYFQRSLIIISVIFIIALVLPVACKWILIGKWKSEKIPIWSFRYFKFWLVKTLISVNPLVMFKGLPLFNVYLRLLGANIGKNVIYEGKRVPVCTDMLSIGDNTIIRRDTILLGYKARAGYIHIGSVAIGSDCYVGEAAVIDINTQLGDGSQLGHVSLLKENQKVPDAKHYHGSPAIETSSNYCKVESKTCTLLRRLVYTSIDFINLFFMASIAIATILSLPHWLSMTGGHEKLISSSKAIILDLRITELVTLSLVLFFSSLMISLALMILIPKLFNYFIKEDKTYVMFGVHFWMIRAIRSMTNSKFLNNVFGDSSAIVYYLSDIGYVFSGKLIQTGSNFGVDTKHDNPRKCTIGSGTMCADGLYMSNLSMSSTSLQLRKTKIGANNYLGNFIHYPPDGRTGDNCLLATKVMIPVDGNVSENVGLLGSPCFEIPRMVEQDKNLSVIDEQLKRKKLFKKNIHNFISSMSYLFWHWLFVFIVLLMIVFATSFYAHLGVFSLLCGFAMFGIMYIAYYVLIERVGLHFAALKPVIVSIYDPMFWRVERYWKHSEDSLKSMFAGTPFKNVITRLCGGRVGKMVFDDGLSITEKSLVDVGDFCTFNADSVLQSHSLEEGVFKTDMIKVESGCTVGINALVHYGTTLEEGCVIESDSFFMKGETAKAQTTWQGNPAKQI